MKYKVIADQLIADITDGRFQPGQRLPSLRQLSKQQSISLTSALNCYRYLEQLGWVESQARSGFYVRRRHSDESLPQQPRFVGRVKALPARFQSKQASSENQHSGPLGVSHLGPAISPTLEIQRSIKRSLTRNQNLLHSYPDPQGHRSLRDALSRHFQSYGFAIAEDDLLISGGCMSAIRTALLSTTEPGDSVAISSPCFSGLLRLLSSMNRRVIEIPCTDQGIDVDQLENLFAKGLVAAALLSSAFMNPNGLSLSVDQKRALAGLANRYRIPIIEDDVYGELGFDATFSLPIKHWDTNGYVLWCSSVSKSLACGLRIGWCAPGRYLSASVQRASAESLGHNSLLQLSLADFIYSGQYQSHLNRVRKMLSKNCFDYRELLLKSLPSGSAVSLPKGGMVLWLEVPNLDATALAKRCNTHDIDLRFGSEFTSRHYYRNCLRLNFGWGLPEHYDERGSVESMVLKLARLIRASCAKQP